MPIQQQHYQITGMKQDNLVGTGFSTQFAHEIKNMRLNTIGDYTTGVWTTEKGTLKKDVYFYGSSVPLHFPAERSSGQIATKLYLTTFIPLGQATINEHWILFGKITNTVSEQKDCILNLFYKDENQVEKLYCKILYFGNLNFSLEHPIETIPYYENENIQKIYFTDGYNQPRVINIANVKRQTDSDINGIDTQFDFVREVALEERVVVEKVQSGGGLFPPCTVKYAITYYDKYGQETNIVYDSPLYYPTKGERGCSPDELSGDAFEITVSHLDFNFEYIRLYSIVRTSNDATPIVRIVADKPLSEAVLPTSGNPLHPEDKIIKFLDTNTTGEIIDPNVLQYVGGRNITAQTFDHKDNTLFLGNIELKTKSVTSIIKALQTQPNFNVDWTFEDMEDPQKNVKSVTFNIKNKYPYKNQLNPNQDYPNNDYSSLGIQHFKKGEYYRFGLQFQDKYGVWSEVYHTDQMDESKAPYSIKTTVTDNTSTNTKEANVLFPVPYIILSDDLITTLLREDYKKVRMVYAKKTNANSKILTQGVIDSTVFEAKTRGDNAPYAMASWFFRPKELLYRFPGDETPFHDKFTFGEKSDNSEYYDLIGFRNVVIPQQGSPSVAERDIEIQNQLGERYNGLPLWRVSRDILTYHSPDLELDDSIKTLDNKHNNFSVIGYIPIDYSTSSYHLNTDVNQISGKLDLQERDFIFTSAVWYKSHIVNTDISYQRNGHTYHTRVYPFHNNDMGENAGYDTKIYTSELVSDMPFYKGSSFISKWEQQYEIHTANFSIDNANWWTSDNNINVDYFTLFDKNGSRYANIPIRREGVNTYTGNSQTTTLTNLIYAGNMDTIAPTTYSGVYYFSKGIVETAPYEQTLSSSKPISFTYKTNTHGILTLNLTGESLFPTLTMDDADVLFYSQQYPNFTERRPYLWLVDMGKSVNENQSINNEVFIPCSPAYTLKTSGEIQPQTNAMYVYGLGGNWYFMRYDCLKTFPNNISDKNQIIEILSFMVESRINLDGRYDDYRGITNNTAITDTNFNLINKSYTQDNDFFAYTTLEKDSAELDKFPNQITYTEVKVPSEDVDAWTNITLAKVDNADGSCGEIKKILNINDRLLLFQDHGIANINYNEKTALTTESGVPIELNSSGEYTGIDYISKTIGCQNKWSISNTKNGLLWVDDSRRELLSLSENFTSVTTLSGFDAFMINNCNIKYSWTPTDDENKFNFITFYDKLSKDIYLINNRTCLAWNEIVKNFTSFYDYDKIAAFANINNHSLAFRINDDNNNGVYALREGTEYNSFFNNTKDYWMTLVCDGMSDKYNNFALDKVFDNIEYRADLYNLDGTNSNYSNPIFNIKHVWNGYQDSEECNLDGIRKFNTWRVQLPRHHGTRNRIRSPFCYIKLKQDNTYSEVQQTDRMILHDLAVSYTIK